MALPPAADIEPDPLQLRLDFHAETVLLHDYAERTVRIRVVSALDIAHTLARELDLTTGLLPSACLWWARTSSGTRVAVWREPRVWVVSLREQAGAPPVRLRLPLPDLVFVCGLCQAPFVFAAKSRPRSATDLLFRFPTFNVFETGLVFPVT